MRRQQISAWIVYIIADVLEWMCVEFLQAQFVGPSREAECDSGKKVPLLNQLCSTLYSHYGLPWRANATRFVYDTVYSATQSGDFSILAILFTLQ